jgi:sulfate transport system ATP-binding protein
MSIVLERLTKRIGPQAVVDQVSLELPSGELFVLLGPSGSGKSTLLRLIAGLASADDGRIVLNGRDVTRLSPQRRGVGFVFQNYSVFRHMTVSRNVEFGLKIRGTARAERTRRREELLELVGLGGLGNRMPHQLSGGQLQRVALARALAYSPEILLLDEPFGALDAKIRVQLRKSLRDIQEELSVTTILVTHDQEEAFDVADRIGLFDRGRLLEQGRPQDLYEHPRTLFAATFVGSGTVLAGRAQEGRANFGVFSLPIPAGAPHEEGARVRLLFRPHEVELCEEKEKLAGPLLGSGEVVEDNFLAGSRRVRLRFAQKPPLRQVAPPLPFGEEGLLVDALLPGGTRVAGSPLWAGLRCWRILDPQPPRLLIVDSLPGPGAALEAGREIARRLRASVVLLSVAARSKDPAAARERQEQRAAEAGLSGFEARTRSGDLFEQILAESSESFYDLIVLDLEKAASRRTLRARASILRLAEKASTPILVLPGTGSSFERMLICTAIGEPGKNDVRVGGWLARWLGAEVTLLHVRTDPGDTPPLVLLHLEQGRRTVQSMGAPCLTAVRRAESAAGGIVEEANAKDSGVIVLGSARSRLRPGLGREDIASQVMAASGRPVLVVPSGAW